MPDSKLNNIKSLPQHCRTLSSHQGALRPETKSDISLTSVTARVKIGQNFDILTKVYSSALKSQTLSNLTCSKCIYRSK